MLLSTFSTNISKLVNSNNQMSEAQIKLLNLIRSKGRFNQLMEVLPDGWEEAFEIKYYENPEEVSHEFREEKQRVGSKVIYDRSILSIIINKQRVKDENGNPVFKYNAVPSKYEEFKRRDYDYPFEANIWKTDVDLSEYTLGSFHIDHKLIWIVQERRVDINSEIKIEDVPYKYSINIYVPTEETLIEVDKLNSMGIF